VQTGVRLEKRTVKVLKALAELYDVSLGQLIEDLVADAFAGRRPLSDAALVQVAELMRIYGLDRAEHSLAVLGPAAQEGE
jgi:predicted DNA-binding ribbon-helix-helix protein